MPSSSENRDATASWMGTAQPAAGTGNIDSLEPVIQPTTWSRSQPCDGYVGDLAAPVEDDHPVGDLVAEREVVGDDHDRDALVGHPADQRLDVLGLLVAERRGRLVEQQDAAGLAVHADRAAGEGDDLALTAGQHLHRPGHRGGADAEPVQLGLRALAHRLAVDEAEPAERTLAELLLAHVEVGRDVLRLDQGQVLVDHLDPGGRGVAGRGEGRAPCRARAMVPCEGLCAPDITLSSVDLPAPLSPSRARTSPGLTWMLMSSSARTKP